MRSRPGFTLIELMVAMALTLFIMVILSQAFILALDTFSALKGVGDMQLTLRSAMTSLQSDLAAPHFPTASGLTGLGTSASPQPPPAGFFFIRQGSPLGSANYLPEGVDADNVPSFRAVDHILHFSVKLQGSGQESFFTTPLNFPTPINPAPGGPINTFYNGCKLFDFMTATQAQDATFNPLVYDPSRNKVPPPGGAQTNFMFRNQWAEVAYFLVQTGSTVNLSDPTSAAGTPLFGLYRAQLVATPYVDDLNGAAAITMTPAANRNNAFWVRQNKGNPVTLSQPFFGMSMSMVPDTGAIPGLSAWPPPPIPTPPPPRPRNPATYPYGLKFYSPALFATNYAPTSAAAQTPAASRGLDFTSHSPFSPPAQPVSVYYGFDALTARNFDKSNKLQFDVTEKAMYYKAILNTDQGDIGNPNPWSQYTTMCSYRTMMASSLLLANVISFHVQVLDANQPPTVSWQDVGTPTAAPPVAGNFLPNIGAIYDTATLSSGLPGFSTMTSLNAIRVTLRIWDPRSQQARQATLIQNF